MHPAEHFEADRLLTQAYDIDPSAVFLAWKSQLRLMQLVERKDINQAATREAILPDCAPPRRIPRVPKPPPLSCAGRSRIQPLGVWSAIDPARWLRRDGPRIRVRHMPPYARSQQRRAAWS